MKQLKLWNGYAFPTYSKQRKVCVAAYSAADARRLFVELGFVDPGASQIRNYWSPMWGIDMKDVVPERGVWLFDEKSRTYVKAVPTNGS